MSERPDPRKRPPDPAGTQPKFDPEALRPSAAAQPALTAGAPARAASPPLPAAAPLLPATAPDAGAPAPATGRAAPQAARFQFLFGALGALAVAAVALTIALLRAPAPAPEAPWSGWKPAQNGVDPAQQIAAYVAPQYRLDNGQQIVQVTGGPPVLKGQPLTIGIVRSGQTPAALEGNNVLYQLCGDGTDCSIKTGKPSTQRGLLVSREALELALYTFRYVSGVDQVLVTLPPPPPGSTRTSTPGLTSTATGSDTSSTSSNVASTTSSSSAHVVNHALLFSEQDLAPELDVPLTSTLSAVAPRVSQIETWPDSTAVKELTEPRIYDFTISETQSAGPIMLLEPAGIGG